MRRGRPAADALRALRAAFPHTLPILTGFLFLGLTYGVLARGAGLPVWYPSLTSLTVFAGSMEFLTVTLQQAAFAPLQALALTLMVNARHLFYGLSMLEKYSGTGLKKPYLIFGLCDETFSVNCAAQVPAGVDEGWFYFFVTLLDQLYWITGTTLGGLLGQPAGVDLRGLDFVMTAMFAVIFLNNWRRESDHTASLAGLGLSAACLVLFGAQRFVLPAMLAILAALTLLRGRLEPLCGKEETP